MSYNEKLIDRRKSKGYERIGVEILFRKHFGVSFDDRETKGKKPLTLQSSKLIPRD